MLKLGIYSVLKMENLLVDLHLITNFYMAFVRGDQNVEIPISFNQRRKMNLPVSASASIGGKSFAAATNPLN